MRSGTYIKTILDNFGGANRDELELCLVKLVNCAKDEEQTRLEKFYEQKYEKPVNKPVNNHENESTIINNNKEVQNENITTMIENIVSSNINDYNKSLLIIKALSGVDNWQPINIIPIDYFHVLWDYYESGKYNVEFDEQREFQYIRIAKEEVDG